MYLTKSLHFSNPAQKENELVEKESFFIVDWVGSNPLNPNSRYPIIVAGNLTKEDLAAIDAGKIKIEPPRFGTVQRVLLKVVAIENIQQK